MTQDLVSPPRVRHEAGLTRALTAGQQAMIGIGGGIGTGLFLASGAAIPAAGPAVILANVLMAGVALLLGARLTEMCVAHPTAGSFGLYAEAYISPFAGYLVRMSYWISQVVVVGGHVTAIAIYMRFWFPGVPGTVWIVLFSIGLFYINARAVSVFGSFEYWFSMVKVVAIVLFVGLGLLMLLGLVGSEAPGLRNYVEHGGFLPRGWTGVWLASCFAFYSFIGVEMAAVASGEAVDPARTIPRAFRRLVLGLSLIYIITTTVLVGIVPWNQLGITESPFVRVLGLVGIPGAAALMNFVVLTAALSSANACLYLVARTLFSLSQSGLVPSGLGAVNSRGVPMNALGVAAVGLASALVVEYLIGADAYLWFIGVALFGALLCWLMIFLTHIAFRRAWDRSGAPQSYRAKFGVAGSVVGALVMLAILVSTWWAPGLRVTLYAAGPWLLIVGAAYVLSPRRTQAEPLASSPNE